VAGDLGAEGLGLSREDEAAIVAEAEVVVNSAATTSFNERFDVAVNINSLGPRRLMRLARRCPNMLLMCHVSTAFANGLRQGPARERAFRIGDCVARELDPAGDVPVLNPYAEIELALEAGRAAAAEAETAGGGWTPAVAAGGAARRSSATLASNEGDGSDGSDGSDGRFGATRENTAAATGAETSAGAEDECGDEDEDRDREPLPLPRLDPAAEAALVRLGSARARLHGWQDTYVFTKAMGERPKS
jgi:hypothetical protein